MTCLMTDDPQVNTLVARELGFQPNYGYVGAAKRLLQQCWYEKKKPAVVANTEEDLRTIYSADVRNHIPLDIVWRRVLCPSMIGHWIHCYDKNSQHLSAEQSVYTGYGNPIHRVYKDSLDVPDMKTPGLYHIVWDASNSRFDGRIYPMIFDKGDMYCTLDVLKFALANSYDVNVLEAWEFPNNTRVFEEYARRLWFARQNLREVSPAAAREINEIAHVTGCWVSSQGEKRPAGGKLDMIHPNWWADIVGCARVRLLANLLSYGSPVLIRTDALYYVSSEPDIDRAIVHAKTGASITARSTECGGFKVPTGWVSFQLTQELYDQAENKSDAELASIFKRAGGIN